MSNEKHGHDYPFYPFNYKNVVAADAVCAVIRDENPMAGYSGHCGYCIFTPEEIPVEWHGDYSADGLGLLNVHGGITYCEVNGGDMEGRHAALKALRAEKDARYAASKAAGEEFVSLWAEYHERSKKLARDFHYSHVVFGFDCCHYGDNNRPWLFDPQHVFKLAHEMRAQIAEHARRITEYREASADRQSGIIDEIRAAASIKSELSPFAMVRAISLATGENQHG